MAFGFLGRRRRGLRRDRGALVAPPGPRMPHEQDQVVQQPPARPKEKLRQAARDEQSGRRDTEARWRATDEFSKNATPEKKPGPVIIRRRYRI